MSTRIAVINQGQVVQQGEPRAIYEQPANDFVAAFIGQSNLLSATIDRVLAHSIAVTIEGGMKIELATPMAPAKLNAGDTLLASVRPEAIELSDAGDPAGDANRITGKIVASAYQGAFVEYEIAVLGKTVKARVANPKGKPLFQRGDRVSLTFAQADLLCVPALAGKT